MQMHRSVVPIGKFFTAVASNQVISWRTQSSASPILILQLSSFSLQ